MRFTFIDAEKAFYPLVVLCRVLEVGRSGFYAWQRRVPSLRAQADQVLESQIEVAFRDSRGTYGSPRIRAQLTAQGVPVSKRRVARLMHRRGLCGLRKARFVRTTDSRHKLPIAPNLLARDFTAAAPNKVWVTDVTFVWTLQGWLYLAAILDLFSRRVVGWGMSGPQRRSPGAGRAEYGAEHAAACSRPDSSQRQGKRILRHRLSGRAKSPRSPKKHEPQRRLLGQCRRRELLRHAQAGDAVSAGAGVSPRQRRQRSLNIWKSTTTPSDGTRRWDSSAPWTLKKGST